MSEKIIHSRNLTPVPCARRCEPSTHVYDRKEPVSFFHHTDIRERFERIKAEQCKPSPNVKQLRKKVQA